MTAFTRYIGIDYSGAQTPTASLKGLRVYMAEAMHRPSRFRRRHPPQILDAARHRRMVGRADGRGRAHAGRHRPRLFISAALFRGRMGSSPTGRHSSTISSAIGRPMRITPMLISSARASTATARRDGQCPMAAADRRARRRCKIGISFRRAGIGGEIHPCRHSLAAFHPPAPWGARAFLAVRRLGHSGRPLGHRRSLSGAVEPRLRTRRPHGRSARRILHRCLAVARRSRWHPGRFHEAGPRRPSGRRRRSRAGYWGWAATCAPSDPRSS